MSQSNLLPFLSFTNLFMHAIYEFISEYCKLMNYLMLMLLIDSAKSSLLFKLSLNSIYQFIGYIIEWWFFFYLK